MAVPIPSSQAKGVLVDGARWYTEPMYQASARLVRYLAARYHIPLDREHIVGHEELPGTTPDRVATMHYDPGPYFDWAHYFQLLGPPCSIRPCSMPLCSMCRCRTHRYRPRASGHHRC